MSHIVTAVPCAPPKVVKGVAASAHDGEDASSALSSTSESARGLPASSASSPSSALTAKTARSRAKSAAKKPCQGTKRKMKESVDAPGDGEKGHQATLPSVEAMEGMHCSAFIRT